MREKQNSAPTGFTGIVIRARDGARCPVDIGIAPTKAAAETSNGRVRQEPQQKRIHHPMYPFR